MAHHDQPPANVEAEQSVLGGMMLSKDAIADVVEELTPGDFYRPAHEAIYDCVLDLYSRGEPADPVTVAAELDKRGDLSRIGGAPYLHTLIATVPTAANAGFYARIVAEKAVLRRLAEASTALAQLAHGGGEGDEITAVVERAKATVAAVAQSRATDDVVPVELLLQATMEELDAIATNGTALGVPTGITDLDHVTNGLHPGQFIIIAARPGAGKTTLGLDILRSCAIKHNIPGLINSLEMSRSELVMKLLAAESKVRLQDMRGGRMTDDDWTRMARRIGDISQAPLFIDDSPKMTMPDIQARARRLKDKHNLGLVVVDYLQLISSGKRVESRQQEVSEFSRALKLLAKELELPVIALSQLNRGPEQRTDKRPMLSDLRESGSLEQDADMVILINRPDAHERDSERAGEADLILAKHRGGPTATISVAHQLHYSRFVDLADPDGNVTNINRNRAA